jgi:hypothetical protein
VLPSRDLSRRIVSAGEWQTVEKVRRRKGIELGPGNPICANPQSTLKTPDVAGPNGNYINRQEKGYPKLLRIATNFFGDFVPAFAFLVGMV